MIQLPETPSQPSNPTRLRSIGCLIRGYRTRRVADDRRIHEWRKAQTEVCSEAAGRLDTDEHSNPDHLTEVSLMVCL